MKIKVLVNEREVVAEAGTSLSEIIKGEKPCGGHGKCGKCKVKVAGAVSEPCDDELKILSDDELERGIRLSCLTSALGDCRVEFIKKDEDAQILTEGISTMFELNPSFSKYGVAIDIGTTTVAACLYDRCGNLLSEKSCLNPQSEWGADVISRIEAALAGKEKELSRAIRITLNAVISELADRAKIDAGSIDGVVITGNTVMLSLLTEESTEPFSHAPFEVKRLFGENLTAKELSLSCLKEETQVYLPYCMGAFVGADLTCALLATGFCSGDTAILADIGTNGEMALWHDGKLTVCSTAAGPAFEGVGISMGMRAALGAIDKVREVDGKIDVHVIGDSEPAGICGSGLLDAVSYMIDNEIIDDSGFMEDGEFIITEPVVVTQKDIRMLQLAKSAICAGLVTLAENEKIKFSDVKKLYIAGGFGNYINIDSAVKTGLIPKELAKVSETVGNAALSGAAMMLLNVKLRDSIKNAEVLDLASHPVFSERYMSGMFFEEV